MKGLRPGDRVCDRYLRGRTGLIVSIDPQRSALVEWDPAAWTGNKRAQSNIGLSLLDLTAPRRWEYPERKRDVRMRPDPYAHIPRRWVMGISRASA